MNSLQWVKNNWNKPAQGIAAFAAAIYSFFAPPAEGIALGSSESLLSLTRVFIIPVVWLIVSVPARQYAEKRFASKWFWISILLFILALAVWITRAELYQSWTCRSELLDRQFVFGETFTADAIEGEKAVEQNVNGRVISDQEAVELLRRTPPCGLIEGAEQNPDRVWQPSEIHRRRTIMSVLYIVGVPVFVLSLIAALQAWYCAGRPD